MSTLIIQSAKPAHPQWIAECMQTVRDYATSRGFDYRFIGDELFDEVPVRYNTYSKVCRSDLGRLQWIRNLLLNYDEVYWVDSDFLIWDAERFELPLPTRRSVVCVKEIWVQGLRKGFPALRVNTNNSVLGFRSVSDVTRMIEYSIQLLEKGLVEGNPYGHCIIGTVPLSQSSYVLKRIRIKSAGCFGHFINQSIVRGTQRQLSRRLFFLSCLHGETMRAANLVSSGALDESQMLSVVQKLKQHHPKEVGPLAIASRFASLYSFALRMVHPIYYKFYAAPRAAKSQALNATP